MSREEKQKKPSIGKELPRGIRRLQNRSFQVYTTDCDGKSHRENFSTLAAAKAHQEKRLAEKRLGMKPTVQGPAGSIAERATRAEQKKDSFGQWMEQTYRDVKAHSSPGSKHPEAFHYKVKELAREGWDTKPANEIDYSLLLDWMLEQEEEREWSGNYFNRWKSFFSRIFDFKEVEPNPARKLPTRQENSRMYFWSDEEEESIFAACKERWPDFPLLADIWMLSIDSGMRKSEQMRSVVGDYNFSAGLLTIRQRKNKTGVTTRTIPLRPRSVEAYKRLCAGKRSGDPLCTLPDKEFKNGKVRENQPIKGWRHLVDEPLELAGLREAGSWHTNRHTCFSRLASAGISLYKIQEYAGHNSHQTTQIYAHLAPKAHEETRKVFAEWDNAEASPATCQACSVTLPKGARFCPSCGTPTKEEAAA